MPIEFPALAKQMTSPPKLDQRAEQLLKKYGYRWDEWHYGFRRVRRVDKESTDDYLKRGPIVIAFEELEDDKLLEHGRTGTGRRLALQRLEQRLKSLDQP